MQLQPAAPRRAREGRRSGGGRDADGVQHDRRQRRGLDGHRGDEGVARQSRGHRRLDRARRPGAPVRRPGLPGRLRQDHPRRRDGARSPRCAGARALQRHDLPGRGQGRPERHGRDRLRGDRRLPRGVDHARRVARDRERRVPRPRSLWRPVHGQHDEHGDGVHRALAGRAQRHPGRGSSQGSGRLHRGRAGHGPRPARHPAVVDRHAQGARERHRERRRDRRFDQRRPPPTGDRARIRDPARHRRVRGDRRPHPDRRRHAAGRPLHGDRHVRGRWRRARHARTAQAAGPPPRWREDRRWSDDRGDRRRRQGDARSEGRRPARAPDQGDRRPRHPARDALPRGLRRQAGRARATPAPRPGPGLRLRSGLLRRGPGPAHQAG